MTKNYAGWRKSRYSEPNGECVEVAKVADGSIGIRDSKVQLPAEIRELSLTGVGWAPHPSTQHLGLQSWAESCDATQSSAQERRRDVRTERPAG